MPNSHRTPDKTRRSCLLCRVRRCKLSVETVRQSPNSQLINVVAWRLVKQFRFSYMQQSTSCLHFAWRTTSLRVGGRVARRSCLPGLRCGGGRQAGATVLSCLVCPCELSRRDKCNASECVRRSHCAARHTPTQNAPIWLSGRLSSHRHTRHDKTVLSVSCLAWLVSYLSCSLSPATFTVSSASTARLSLHYPPFPIHRVKRCHRIYGYKTIAILWL